MPGLLGSTKYEILFGSSFPNDQKTQQIYSNINKIKICMETGVQVILCNLDNLYESLYGKKHCLINILLIVKFIDVLNQQYSWMGGHRYVDLGLGTHRVKCR